MATGVNPRPKRGEKTHRRERPDRGKSDVVRTKVEAFDTRSIGHHDACMAGRVEVAIRASVTPGDRLLTPTGRGAFTVARYTDDALVLLLGKQEAWTPISWRGVEEIPDLLRGRSWVFIGSSYSMDAVVGTLDAHLKKFLARATAGWVAVVLEKAGVVEIDRDRPARVRLGVNW